MSGEQKEVKLKDVFKQHSFTESDLARVLNLSQSNSHYHLHKLLKQKKISRIARGKYQFLSENIKKKQKAVSQYLNTPLIEYIQKSLLPVSTQHNKQFSITSTSFFNKFYPLTNYITIYVEKGSSSLFLQKLAALHLNFVVINNPSCNELELLRDHAGKRDFIIVREKNYFYSSKQGLASVESAFVDYYFEISRKKLPLNNKVEEILDYLLSHNTINLSTMLRYAKERGIREELANLFNEIKLNGFENKSLENFKRGDNNE